MESLKDLLAWFIEFLESAKFWKVVEPYEEGVVTRLGHYRKTLKPGLHWVIPFADKVVEDVNTQPTTITLPAQTITLKDKKVVVVKAMVKCQVFDSKGYSLDVWDAKDAVGDTSCGVILETLRKMTLDEALDADLSAAVTISVRRELKKWFISVLSVTLTDFGEVATFRLINEGKDIG